VAHDVVTQPDRIEALLICLARLLEHGIDATLGVKKQSYLDHAKTSRQIRVPVRATRTDTGIVAVEAQAVNSRGL
jgi:hypothetical protein